MSVLAFATSPSEVVVGTPIAAITANTTTADIAPFVDEGIEVAGGGNQTDGFDIDFAAAGEIWISFYMTIKTTIAGATFSFLKVYDGAQELFQIDMDSALHTIEYWDGAAWVETYTEVAMTVARTRWDVHIKMNDTTGVLATYINGGLAGTWSGDSIRTASTTVNKARFQTVGSSVNGDVVYSAIIIANEDTRAMLYASAKPTASGAFSEMTGTFADVDDVGINDVDYLTATTSGQRHTFTTGALPAGWATDHDIVMVGTSARAAKAAAGVTNLRNMIRSNTTDAEGSSVALDVTHKPLQTIWALDPATTAAWTFAAADAAQIGVKAA